MTGVVMRTIVVFCCVLMLAACSSNSREHQAADACVAEISKRLSGKTFEVDANQLAASAKVQDADSLQLAGSIIFDRGFAKEYAQTLDCRVRFDGSVANVIFLQFNWSMEDLKKAGQPGE